MADEEPPIDNGSGADNGGTTVTSAGSGRSDEYVHVSVEDELKQSYLGYAMSVIVGRALPDVRDGLKPVHRRVLYAMGEINNVYNRPYVKSARVVGEVTGKYHPHGEVAVYESIVRMAQDFRMRYLLVDGQGNFGSIDDDPAAAQRYTEVRMTEIASSLLSDLNMDTVDFVPNYDETLECPEVLPTRIPNLLVNGSDGIAVGMATKIPPHNLGEIVDASVALIANPDLDVDSLLEYVKGPDFPTYGTINGRAGIVSAYRTGRGRIRIRSRATVEGQETGKESIVITEIPFHEIKARLIEKIAELHKDKRITGITDVRDLSDKEGLRIHIDLKRGENGEIVLNNLYAHTNLEKSYSINCVALVGGQPKLVNLKQMLDAFLEHRRDVVFRRTIFRLREARSRAHILEGRAIALENIDEVVALIRGSETPAEARAALMDRGWETTTIAELLARVDISASRPDDLEPEFGYRATDTDSSDEGEEEFRYFLSERQARSILEMQLDRLTNLRKSEITAEYEEILAEIADLLDIIDSVERIDSIVRDELLEVKAKFADERRTEILDAEEDLNAIDLIAPEESIITVSRRGYAKRQSLSVYVAQGRGGVGKSATSVREDDFVSHLIAANTHDTLLLFSNMGKVYWLNVYRLPTGSRTSLGRPLVNLVELDANEHITAILPLKENENDRVVVMATSHGIVKRVELSRFNRPYRRGLIAVNLSEDETLVGVLITDGHSDVMLVTDSGRAVRFNESEVRLMGRTARGVRGVRLPTDARVIALLCPSEDGHLLTASENGLGKCTPMSVFPPQARGGLGRIAAKTDQKTGSIQRAVQVWDNDEVILITQKGTMIRTKVSNIRVTGRYAIGVRLISMRDDTLIGLERVVETSMDDLDEIDSSTEGDSPSNEIGEPSDEG